jgi:Tol biopolymer transport system component
MISIRNTVLPFVTLFPVVVANSAMSQSVEPRKLIGLVNEESSWSPDGKTIAFDSIRAGKLNIYTWRIDTREVKRITMTEANDFTPEFSPTGKQIAFVSDRTGHNEVFVIDLESGAARQVTKDNSDAIHPNWSSDSQRIVYCSSRDNPNQANAPEGEVYEIYTIKSDATDRQQITHKKGINTYPSLSPDGRQILFRKVLGEKNSEIFVMNADGSSQQNLTNDPAFDAWPRWSPDGKRIVFGSNRENNRDYEIYVMNVDGSSVQQLTHVSGRNTSPKWSPDGNKISFDHAMQGECDIFTIDAPQK